MEEEARKIFAGTAVKIMVEGQRHLGVVVGSKEYKDQYCSSKVFRWTDEIKSQTEIARSQPQAANTAFIKGYQSKFTYLMRTIPNFEDYMESIEDIFSSSLISTLSGSDTPLPDHFT